MTESEKREKFNREMQEAVRKRTQPSDSGSQEDLEKRRAEFNAQMRERVRQRDEEQLSRVAALRNGKTIEQRAQALARERTGEKASFVKTAPGKTDIGNSGRTGFYDKPELGGSNAALSRKTAGASLALKRQQESLKLVEERVVQVEQGLKTVQDALEQVRSAYEETPNQELAEQYQQLTQAYGTQYRVYEDARRQYLTAYEAYAPYEDALAEALAGQQVYATNQKRAYDTWRSQIRDADAVKVELDALDAQIKQLGITELADRREALEQQRENVQREYDWAKALEYAELEHQEDYETLSRYRSTANGSQPQRDWVSGNYTQTGYEDLLYDYINGNRAAREVAQVNAGPAGKQINGYDIAPLGQMREDEVKTFNYLYATRGKDQAYQYVQYLQQELNARQRTAEGQSNEEEATEHPVLASAASVLMAPGKALSLVGQVGSLISTGQIDPNAWYNRTSWMPNDLRGQVSRDVEQNWGKVGSFAYDTGMSIADNLWRQVTLGTISQKAALAVMGSGAAADEVISAKERGLSDRKALGLGLTAGLLEAGIESMNLDDVLLKPDVLADGVARYILKNTAAEGAEEALTGVANILADTLIAGDESQWNRDVQKVMEEGKTAQEASFQVFWDRVKNVGLDTLSGAISGGVLSGVNAGRIGGFIQQSARELESMGLDAQDIQAFLDEGLESAEGTASRTLAEQMMGKIQRGQTLSKYDLARLYQANIQEVVRENREKRRAKAGQQVPAEVNAGPVAAQTAPNLMDRIVAERNEIRPKAGTAPGLEPGNAEGVTKIGSTAITQPVTAGDEISDGSGKRNDGLGTGAQVGRMAERAGTAEAQKRIDTRAAAAQRKNLAKGVSLQQVSTQQLEIARGTEEKRARVLPAELWDEGMRQAAQEARDRAGVEVTYVLGKMEVQGKNGTTVSVRGVYDGKRIIAQADNIAVTAEQIVAHEQYHALAQMSGGLQNKDVVEYLRSNFTEEELGEVLELYIQKLEDAMGYTLDEQGRPDDAAMERIVEELLADAYGGINAFKAGADRFAGAVQQRMGQLWNWGVSDQANGVEMPNGPNDAPGAMEAPISHHAEQPQTTVAAEQPQTGLQIHGDATQVPCEVVPIGEWSQEMLQVMMMMAEEKTAGVQFVWGPIHVRDDTGTVRRVNAAPGTENGVDVYVIQADHERKSPVQIAREIIDGDIGSEPLRYSIDYDQENRPFVTVEEDILAGVPESQWVPTVKRNLKEKFPNGITVGNNEIRITNQSRKELTRSRSSGRLYKTRPDIYADKLRATNNSDEILYATQGWVNEGLHHSRNDGIQDFARGNVQINVGGQMYEAEVAVANKGNGNLILYDILGMKPRKKQTSEFIITKANKPGDRHPISASTNSIPADGENVNGNSGSKFSVPFDSMFDSDARFSTDEEFDRVEVERKANLDSWGEQWLRDRLGDEGYEEYRKNLAAREEQEKQDRKAKERARRLVERNKRSLRKEYVDAEAEHTMHYAKEEAKEATESRKEFRRTVLNLFSIPVGEKTAMGDMVDAFAKQVLRDGYIDDRAMNAMIDKLYETGVMTAQADEYYAQGYQYMRQGRIYVPDGVREEFGDDWGAFRQRAFGCGIYLTNDRDNGGIDQWNMELAELMPGSFDPEETDLKTILEQIVEVAEEGKDQKMRLPEFAAWMAGRGEASENELLEDLERQMDWSVRTFAQKAKLEVRLKEQSATQVAGLKKKNIRLRNRLQEERLERQEKARRERDRKALREMQEKTLKALQWLNRNKRKASEELRQQMEALLSDMDLYAIGAANEMKWHKGYNATWQDLAQMYQAARHTPNFLPSAELERITARLTARKIEDLKPEDLMDLYQAAVGLRTELYNRNNLLESQTHQMLSEVYEGAVAGIRAAPGGRQAGKEAYEETALDRLMNREQLSPVNAMLRYVGWDESNPFCELIRQLERGERDMRAYHVEAERMLEGFLTEHEDWVKKCDGQGKDAIWYEIKVPELLELGHGDAPIFGDTVTVYMTPAQKVHLYLESKHYDNLEHMVGGRTFVNKALYEKGERENAFAQGTTIRLAPETVKALVANLTPEEQVLAGLLERYYNDYATKRINRVSNVLHGFDKAITKHYAPIYTNANYNAKDLGKFDATAEGVGSLKERIHGVNPSRNISALDAFERHMDMTARYVGMAIPARNWNSILNWQETVDGESDGENKPKTFRRTSFRDELTQKWGKDSVQYIEDTINALQSGESVERNTVTTMFDTIKSRYITATFGANPSVVLKQLGSIGMAMPYLGAQNAPGIGQVASIDRGLIRTYTQDLDWRLMGYAMPETRHLKDNPTGWVEKTKFTRDWIGGGAITAMDGWAASTLWPWAENKVRREHPELEIGTKDQIEKGESPFYKKVAQEFENAVSKSQSTTDIMHQSVLRRSKDQVVQIFTLFGSDSAQTYNTLRYCLGRAQYLKRTKAGKEELRKAKRAVGEAVGAMLLNGIWAEAVGLAMALWKNKGKYYRDEEEELTAESIAKEAAGNFLSSIAGTVIGGEYVYEALGWMFTGEKPEIPELLSLAQLESIRDTLFTAADGIREVFAGAWDVANHDGNVGQYLSDHTEQLLGAIKDVSGVAATYGFSLPARNLEAYLIGALKWISPEMGAAWDDVWQEVGKNDLTGLGGEVLEYRVAGILADRGATEREDTAERIAALYAQGYTGTVPSGIPPSITVGEESIRLKPHQEHIFQTVWGSTVAGGLDALTDSSLFEMAEEAEQENMVKGLFAYATAKAKGVLFPEYDPGSTVAGIDSTVGSGASLATVIAWNVLDDDLKKEEKMVLLADLDLPEKEKEAIFWNRINGTMEDGARKELEQVIEQFKEDGYGFRGYLTAAAGGYDDYITDGMTPDNAKEFSQAMDELVPMEGETNVSNLQKWRVCVDFSDNTEDQLTALSMVMTQKQMEKVDLAHALGVDPERYVELYEVLPRFGEDRNGAYRQSEITAALDSMGSTLTQSQQAVLWQIVTGASSTKNNPYDKALGQTVLDRMAQENDAVDNDSISFAEEVMRQLMGEG